MTESLHFASLERIFIEERIYKDKQFENAKTMDEACEWIDNRLTPWYPKMVREVTKDDILKLMEIKMAHILKFNKDKADELIARINELSAKSRTPEGLTEEENAERELLRKDYVARFRASMKAELDSTVIVYPDGTRKPLRKQ